MNLDPGFLLASVIWGAIGLGFLIYGKRQKEVIPLVAGIGMMAASYLAPGPWSMSGICLLMIATVYFLRRLGWF
jgi:hypothetical protein